MPESIKSLPFTLNFERVCKIMFNDSVRRKWPVFLVLDLFMGAVFTYLLSRSTLPVPPWIGFIVALVLLPGLITGSFKKYLTMMRKPANRMMFLSQTIGISATEFTKEAEDASKSVIKLSAIPKLERKGEFTLVYVSEYQAFFVPDGVWHSPEDEAQFKAWLQAGTGLTLPEKK